LYLQMNSLRVE
nr:immunoglobulin heavy chain junction region [Homo sapiens]